MPYKTVKPADAKALLDGDEGWTYVDVRTVEEFEAGHPVGAYNVPFAVRDKSGMMTPNPRFVPLMKRHFARETLLVLGCAAGGRSRHACEQLLTEGFKNLINMHGGFSGARDEMGRVCEPGWQACGYPVETACEEERTWRHLSSAT
jgi:rhodanese-related sulfurtransferase